MIVASCPLRISIVGGTTDHPRFIDQFGHGSVISFPSTLRTYVTIHQDVFGTNTIDHNYNINYSKRETVKNIADIKNELIRYCFEFLEVDQINCSLASDIYSVGSGLAASSSYIQAIIKAVYVWRGEHISEFEVCKIAEQIEKRINPLVGQQDFYGSMGGLKRINFFKDRDPEFKYLLIEIFEKMDIYLLYTGVLRNSTTILDSMDITKSLPMLDDVNDLEMAITYNDVDKFHQVVNRSWITKKSTSSLMCENEIIEKLDLLLHNDPRVRSHKLCGGGNGGYFLIFANKGLELDREYPMTKPISISETGLKYINLKNEFTQI